MLTIKNCDHFYLLIFIILVISIPVRLYVDLKGENAITSVVDGEENLSWKTLNISKNAGELCNRVCQQDNKRVCYFNFVLEHYQAMGVACGKCAEAVATDCNNLHCVLGDGVERGVMSINRQIPGPMINVCEGDYIVIDVTNMAMGTAASLHWHGLHMRETPYMDGVPFVTQCPILYANTFRYEFYAKNTGTQYYHSHAGHHKVNGQYGPLIIRQPLKNDPQHMLYDYDLSEHVMLVSDWLHTYGEHYFPGLPHSKGIGDALLINGRGQYGLPERRQIPPAVFYVNPKKRYRFRFINSLSELYILKMQIEKHTFDVIAVDSYNVKPQTFDTLISNAGERFDFVLYTNHSRGDFWIRVRTLDQKLESFAVLRYITDDSIDDAITQDFNISNLELIEDQVLNHPNATCENDSKLYCITALEALTEEEDLHRNEPDEKFTLAFEIRPISNGVLFQQNKYFQYINPFSNHTLKAFINNISLIHPDSPPLTQTDDIDETQYCNHTNVPDTCMNEHLFCSCVHRVQVKLNSLVEIILVDVTNFPSNVSHPFHLHGHKFIVAGLGLDLNEAKNLKSEVGRQRTTHKLPFKDTLTIPEGGYAKLRFKAVNPGYWMLHCHYESHLTLGMGLIVQVGTTSQMIKSPKNFPRCGNYVPPLKAELFQD